MLKGNRNGRHKSKKGAWAKIEWLKLVLRPVAAKMQRRGEPWTSIDVLGKCEVAYMNAVSEVMLLFRMFARMSP